MKMKGQHEYHCALHGHAHVEHPCEEARQLYPTASLAALLGRTVHTFSDGMAIMTGFGRSTGIGP